MDRSADSNAQPLYRYRFEDAEFDEARMELRVAGARVELEQRPAQALRLLLLHADEVVPRAELFDRVWAGRPTVDNVLANAVAKLRKALGPRAARRIATVPRIGYRLHGPVERSAAGRRHAVDFALTAGQAVPGREHFRLQACLDPHGLGLAWRARNQKTGASVVFKFALDGERLSALKREATIHRLLRESLEQRNDLVRLVDWNFDDAPYWLQCEDGGDDLQRWARAHPAFAASPREQRIGWFLQIADAVQAAHGAGVLHKDLKPSNVLVAQRGDGWQLRVADFGSGRLLEAGRLEELGITRAGMTISTALPAHSGMTLLYVAPEVLTGQPPSVRSDVYALGLILLQMVAGDLQRTLAPGWEQAVGDDLLREDIAAATDGDPDRRLQSVEALAQRLRSRDTRMLERRRLRESDARALAAEQALQRAHARRPWLVAALALLVIGLGVSLWQIGRVRSAQAEARRQSAIADAANRFLIDDVLGAGAGDSAQAWYQRNPTLREILDNAARHLDARFAGEPEIRAGLHQTLGRAYRSTGDYANAAVQLQAAADDLQRTPASDDERGILALYELAPMLAHLSRFADATAVLDRADTLAGNRLDAVSDLSLRAHMARGDVAYQRMDVKSALPAYLAALRAQERLHPGDAALSAHLLLSIAGCRLRLDQAGEAEAIARKVLAGGPYTQARIGLAAIALAHSRLGDALRAQGRLADAIAATRLAVREYERAQGADGQGTISALSSLGYLRSLDGDEAGALQLQREVYRRTAARWGKQSQYALVELLNLGSSEYDAGQLQQALAHLRDAASGLQRVSGGDSPVTQAARVAEAAALSDLGRNREALALIADVDPGSYQATTSNPGRASILEAMKARILLRLGRRAEGASRLRAALSEMEKTGVSAEEAAPYRALLDAH
jgi:non-specific serine/threonine protein kinase